AARGLPALRPLALRNSQIADAIARALAKAPIVARLRVLDLSLGTLSDQGAEALLAVPGLANLEMLDIHHHYVSPELVRRLAALGIKVNASDFREAEEEYPDEGGDEDELISIRYVAHAE